MNSKLAWSITSAEQGVHQFIDTILQTCHYTNPIILHWTSKYINISTITSIIWLLLSSSVHPLQPYTSLQQKLVDQGFLVETHIILQISRKCFDLYASAKIILEESYSIYTHIISVGLFILQNCRILS